MFPEERVWGLSYPLALLTMNAELTFNLTKSNLSKKNSKSAIATVMAVVRQVPRMAQI